ncbi:MAG: excinuclease ABC subunit C, partial [Gammaproteobacteria bacterium]|nr:excinuclease ABC subunit C [Gammaproteobacteria bacterium]
LLIDGGKGQVGAVATVLDELGIDGVKLVGVSKGPDRKPGAEQLWPDGGQPILAGADSPALHLVQQIRDEAHRFAITGHRQRRDKARKTSMLTRAAPEDIARVEGISRTLARQIHEALHQQSDRA